MAPFPVSELVAIAEALAPHRRQLLLETGRALLDMQQAVERDGSQN